jgi:hypothetical protein
MKHLTHRMHEHSVAAYRAEEAKLSKRAQAIVDWITTRGPRTDREIAYGLGFGENLNAVRPRITELIESNRLMEGGRRACARSRASACAAWTSPPSPGGALLVIDARTRMLKIAQLLYAGQKITSRFIADHFGVSLSTGKRDVTLIEQALPAISALLL